MLVRYIILMHCFSFQVDAGRISFTAIMRKAGNAYQRNGFAITSTIVKIEQTRMTNAVSATLSFSFAVSITFSFSATRTCGPGQFHCRLTGICIPMGYRCDREVDCGFTVNGIQDRSDEEDSHCNLTLNCPANQHKCLTVDTCVELVRFCDKTPDCPDLSDEGAFCNGKL